MEYTPTERREPREWRELVVKSTVVPQRSARLRDRQDKMPCARLKRWKLRANAEIICDTGHQTILHTPAECKRGKGGDGEVEVTSLLTVCLFVGWLLNVPETCECISGTDLLRQFYVLPH